MFEVTHLVGGGAPPLVPMPHRLEGHPQEGTAMQLMRISYLLLPIVEFLLFF